MVVRMLLNYSYNHANDKARAWTHESLTVMILHCCPGMCSPVTATISFCLGWSKYSRKTRQSPILLVFYVVLSISIFFFYLKTLHSAKIKACTCLLVLVRSGIFALSRFFVYQNGRSEKPFPKANETTQLCSQDPFGFINFSFNRCRKR